MVPNRLVLLAPSIPGGRRTLPSTDEHQPLRPIDEVRGGLGVGLAWRHLVQEQLDKGALVQPLVESYLAEDRRHYFVYRRDLALRGAMLDLRNWMLRQASAASQA
ncbi:LysR substrate-binding domain-containing protein [Pseudomonas oryzihabitans]|uniref:LysR substrate-binding domain-containing protein n=1 Tax=Pseudomonas oryzihabitans TaxID=47885 RepID=UPI003B20BA50